jgi:DNA-binding transcriptional LysR family regulator
MDEWMGRLAPELRALLETDEQDGFVTAAAQSLRIPQSTLSRRIRALEDLWGFPLLVRTGRRAALTPRARELAAAVRGPLAALERAIAATAGEADPEGGRVRFGFPLTMGQGRAPELLAAFRRAHPGIRMELRQAHGTALFEDLRLGRLDLALTIPAPGPEDGARGTLEHRVMGRQRIVAVLPEAHPCAGRDVLRLEELADAQFIGTPRPFHLRRLTEAWCAAAGFTPQVDIEAAEFAAIRELVALGMGVALLPALPSPLPGTAEVPLAGEPAGEEDRSREIALVRAAVPLSPPAQSLWDFLARAAEG